MNQQSDVLILLGYRQWDGADTSRYVDVITPDGIFLSISDSIIRRPTIESLLRTFTGNPENEAIGSLEKDQIEFTFTDYDEARAFLMLLEN